MSSYNAASRYSSALNEWLYHPNLHRVPPSSCDELTGIALALSERVEMGRSCSFVWWELASVTFRRSETRLRLSLSRNPWKNYAETGCQYEDPSGVAQRLTDATRRAGSGTEPPRNDPTNLLQNKSALFCTLALATSSVFRASRNSLILPFSATSRAKKS